jgi:hypothetical protein
MSQGVGRCLSRRYLAIVQELGDSKPRTPKKDCQNNKCGGRAGNHVSLAIEHLLSSGVSVIMIIPFAKGTANCIAEE